MTFSPQGGDPEAQGRLEELGYTQELRRRLKVWHVVGLAMADVSPTMAVLFLTAGVFFVGGTFALGANLILAVVVTLIALCLAELAAMYPVAGDVLAGALRLARTDNLDHDVQLLAAGRNYTGEHRDRGSDLSAGFDP
jgi:hypothetical protein